MYMCMCMNVYMYMYMFMTTLSEPITYTYASMGIHLCAGPLARSKLAALSGPQALASRC